MIRNTRALALGALVFAAHVHATTTANIETTTSTTTWVGSQYITGGFTAVSFGSFSSTSTFPSGLNLSSGFDFTALQGSSDVLKGGYGSTGSLGLLGAPDGSITLALPSGGETALFMGLGDTMTSATLSLELILSDGSTATYTPTVSVGTFGFSSSLPITSVVLSTTSGDPVFYNLYYATSSLPPTAGGTGSGGSGSGSDPASVPEASTSLLAGGGLLLLFFSTGRKLILRKTF